MVLTLYREATAAIPELGVDTLEQMTPAELTGWEWLSTQDQVTAAAYGEALELPTRTAKNHLKKLTDLGLLKKVGAARATRYEVVRP